MGDFIPSERPFWMQIGTRSPKTSDCAGQIVHRAECKCGTREDLHPVAWCKAFRPYRRPL